MIEKIRAWLSIEFIRIGLALIPWPDIREQLKMNIFKFTVKNDS